MIETAAMMAVDHSNVLTRRRRSAMNTDAAPAGDSGDHPGR
jgi:hypothetical protein